MTWPSISSGRAPGNSRFPHLPHNAAQCGTDWQFITEDKRSTTKIAEELQLEAPADRPRLESMDEQQERLTEIEELEEESPAVLV